MKHDDLKHNASGYYDETSYLAIKSIASTPKPGEIWMDKKGEKHFLILQSMGGVCSTLLLGNAKKENSIMVMAKVPMYTNPIMIAYTFTYVLGDYVKTVPDDKMDDIKKAVAKALGITAAPDDSNASMKEMEEKVQMLTLEREEVMREAKALTSELNKAIEYKELYNTLLDKLVAARGGDICD